MFKTFPAFSQVTLADKEQYELLTKGYPSIADSSFASLMTWWDTMGGLAISHLNGNLVISYWIPGDDKHSGIALIGTEKIDESICTIFDYMREKGEKPRLFNVPEFVVNSMRYPELFAFDPKGGDDEYVVSLSKFSTLEAMPLYLRTRIKRFIREVGEEKIKVKSIDLSLIENQQMLIELEGGWPLTGVNNLNKLERDVLPVTISRASVLGIKNVCLYVNGVMQGFCLYCLPGNDGHAVILHARVNYTIPRLFDYGVHVLSKYLIERGIEYINIDADNDSMKMRALKLALKPQNFFRKYTIEPIEG